MDTQTKEALGVGTEFLKDSIELAHLMLKRKLEAARKGEDVDWKEAAQIMKEGRSAARQITQNASLELRKRKLALDEAKSDGKRAKRRAPIQPAQDPTPEDRERFMELSKEWMAHVLKCVENPGTGNGEYPDELKAMIKDYGLDPQSERAAEKLGEWLFPESEAA